MVRDVIFGRYWRNYILPLLLAVFTACAPVQLQQQPQPQESRAVESDVSPTLFRFVFTGDSRGDYKADPPVYLEEELLIQITGHILALEPRPEFVIFNGDMVAKTTFNKAPEIVERWRAIFEEPLESNNIKVYTSPGNHVVYQEKPCAADEICYVSRFNKYFQPDNPLNGPVGYEGVTYSFTRENTHFVTVTSFMTHNGPDNTEVPPGMFVQKKNNFEYFINQANRDWFREDLEKDNSEFTIFFTHCPLYPVGPHNEDMKSLHSHPANRDEVVGILAADGVDAVFVSHEHLYARSNLGPDNPAGSVLKTRLPQIVVGSASAPLDLSPARADMTFASYLYAYGFVVADVKKDRIEFRTYNEKAQQIDSFTVTAD